MVTKKFRATIYRDGAMCFVPVPFDPKAVFGKVRAPVVVTLGAHSYRSTIASMGGTVCVPLRKSNREAAGLEGGETLTVTLTLDEEERHVDAPADLLAALAKAKVRPAWDALSYSHRREHVEAILEAKKPETRARRIDKAVAMVASKPPR